MLYDAIGISSTTNEMTVMFLGLSLLFALPVAGIVLIVRYLTKYALAKHATAVQKTNTEFRFHVFLSYSARDRSNAELLTERLQRAEIKVFFADRELEGGVPFTEEIRKALHESRETWLLATPSSITSVWVATEWGTAWALGRKIVPVLLGLAQSDLPDRLRLLQAVEYLDIQPEIGRARKRLTQGSKLIPMPTG